jgi:sorbitol/mannitol transport system permease protein
MSVASAGRRGGLFGRSWSVLAWSLLAWLVAIVFFFPLLWMALEGFKTEAQAASTPPTLLFVPTFANFRAVFSDINFTSDFTNSAVVTIGSTLVVLMLALPAAYALAIRPVKRTQDVLLFFIGVRYLPFAASLVPLYLLARDLHLQDTQLALVIIYTLINLPLAVWLLRSFMLEIPRDLFEAARVDGAYFWHELWSIMLPMIMPGVAATALICVIFSWNEFFYAVNLTGANAATAPIFMKGFIQGEGLFYASLSAAATVACLPVLMAGWFAQKQLVRGLTMGAVK